MRADDLDLVLLCSIGSRFCALPLLHVAETMRPMPVEPTTGAPPYIMGLAIIRGMPVAVIDTACLIGGEPARPSRLVTLAIGNRHIALVVDRVLGIRRVPAKTLGALPPLLDNADSGIIAAIGMLDAQLLLVLNDSRLMPDDAIGEDVPA